MHSLQLRYGLLTYTDMNIAVCASDQLKLVTFESFCIIVNSQSSEKAGQHWLAFFCTQNNNCIEFFDSFGMPIEFYGEEFVKFAQRYNPVVVNDQQYQSNFSDVCGNFCHKYLIQRSKNITSSEIVSNFSLTNLIHNDNQVRNFVLQISFPDFSKCGQSCLDVCCRNKNILSSVCVQLNKKCYQLGHKMNKKLMHIN